MRAAAVVSTVPLSFLLAYTFGSCSSPTDEGDFRTHLFTLYDAEGEPVTPQLFVGPVLWVGDDGFRFRIEGGLVSCSAVDPGEYYAWSLARPDGTYEYGASRLLIECRRKNGNSIAIRDLDSGEVRTARVYRPGDGCARMTIRLPESATFKVASLRDGTGFPPDVRLPPSMPMGTYADYSCDRPVSFRR